MTPHTTRSTWAFAACLALAVVLCALSPVPAFAFVDPHEPDGTLEEAKQVATDGSVVMLWHEDSQTEQNADWIRFDAKAGKTYRLHVKRVGFVGTPPVPTFHDALGVLIEHESPRSGTEWYFYATEDGPAFVRVSLVSAGTGTYIVGVTEGDASSLKLEDAYEPDDTVRSARDISLDGTRQYRVMDWVDWIRLPVRKGMVYRIDSDMIHEGTISVLNAAGATIPVSVTYDDFPPPKYFMAPEDGVYHLKIVHYGSLVFHRYTLAVTEMPTSSMRGVVTRAAGGLPVPGARVIITPSYLSGFHGDANPVAIAIAGTDGTWSADVQPGLYVVRFEDPLGLLLPEYWGGVVPPATTATPIQVGDRSVMELNGRLWSKSAIEALVVDGKGVPVPGVSVSVDRPGGADWNGRVKVGEDVSDVSGKVRFSNLDPRLVHRLTAQPTASLAPVGAMDVPLSTGATATPTFKMTVPGRIVGRVMDGNRGAAAKGTVVELWGSNYEGLLPYSAVVGDDGRYVITNLPAGPYRVSFTDPAGEEGPYGRLWHTTSPYGWPDTVSVELAKDTSCSVTFYDRLPPTTYTTATSEWQREPVRLTFEAVDQGWMGATTLLKRADASQPETYTGPITISKEGTTTLTYWSVDGLSANGTRNVEKARTLNVRVDTGIPVTAPKGVSDGSTLMAPAVIELDARDAVSGVKNTRWAVGPREGSGPLVDLSEPGQYTIQYSTEDVAGNREATRTLDVSVSTSTGLVGRVAEPNPSNSGYRLDPSWPPAGFETALPTAMAFDRARNRLYTALPLSQGVRRLQWDGRLLDHGLVPGAQTLSNPIALGVAGDGTLMVVSEENPIAIIDPNGVRTAGGSTYPRRPIAGDLGPEGARWLADSRTMVTREFAGVTHSAFVPMIGGIAVGPTGEAYCVTGDQFVIVYSPKLAKVRTWSVPQFPLGVAVDGDGYVYVSMKSGVVKYSPAGEVIERFGTGGLKHLACDAFGHLYAADPSAGVLRRFTHGLQGSGVTVTGVMSLGRLSTLHAQVRPKVAGIPVRVQYSSDGESWSDVATGRTAAGGVFTFTGQPKQSGRYRVLAGGDRTFAASASGTVSVTTSAMKSPVRRRPLLQAR